MITPAQEAALRVETQNQLANVRMSAPILASRAKVEKVYEIFVLSCLLSALKNLEAEFSLRDSCDEGATNLRLRLGPGLLYAPHSAPGFIHVTYKGAEFEVQNSLRILGRSRVLHELDVSLIERAESEKCRTHRSNPHHSRVKFLAECKFYGSGLPLSLGREYLGLCDEFGLRIRVFVSNVGSEDVRLMIKGHNGTTNFEISPWKPDNVTTLTKWLENELMQVLP